MASPLAERAADSLVEGDRLYQDLQRAVRDHQTRGSDTSPAGTLSAIVAYLQARYEIKPRAGSGSDRPEESA